MSTVDYLEMKAALKEALVELFQERRELFHDLVREVIQETDLEIGSVPATASRPDASLDNDFEDVVEHEIQAFHRLHPTLLAQYPDEFVAIYNQELVDHDPEKLALYQRIPAAISRAICAHASRRTRTRAGS